MKRVAWELISEKMRWLGVSNRLAIASLNEFRLETRLASLVGLRRQLGFEPEPDGRSFRSRCVWQGSNPRDDFTTHGY